MTPVEWLGPIVTLAGGLLVGAILGGFLVAWRARRRQAGLEYRWESRAQAADAELACNRLEQARLMSERTALETDLAVLNDTVNAQHDEITAYRTALQDAGRQRDLARRRAEAAVDELVHTRLQLVEAQAAQADHETRLAELKASVGQQSVLAARLDQAAKARAEAESTATRLTVMVQSLEQQLRQAGEAARADRDRADLTRAGVAAQVLERQRRLEQVEADRDRLDAEVRQLEARTAELTAAVALADGRTRAADLRREEEVARLEAQLGSLQAQAERLEPLRRQVVDREELLRSLARERDDSAAALVRQERELRAEIERLTGLLAEATVRGRRLGEREVRLAEVEARLAAALKERDHYQTAERAAVGRIASLSAELRERDIRFRTLLDDRRTVVEAAQSEIGRLRDEIDRLKLPPFGNLDPASEAVDESSELYGTGAGAAILAAPRPLRFDAEPEPAPSGDDLKRISGIGPAIERALQVRGVTTFRQIAQWTDADIDHFGSELGSFRNRIRRDRWIEQARREHELAHGEHLDP